MIDPDDLIEEMNETDNQASRFIVVEKNVPPIASFTHSPEKPVINQTIIFNASNSTDPDGNITKYDWDFGDGNSTNTTEEIINHSYLLAGDYTVNLTVTDNEGAMNSSSQWIIVTLKAPPEITFYDPKSPVNDTVCTWRTFNVTVNQTVNVSWYLNDTFQFTNESVREAKCTLHAAVAGEHNVTANASNANGTDTQTWDWNVTKPVVVTHPEIMFYAPESPVNDSEGATRMFNITINQTVNVSWQINGTVVQTDIKVTEASYTNLSAVVGTWNVSAIVNNTNGTDMQTWVWTVEPSPCFIATAAYGTALHEDIDVLRDFRDDYLMPNPAGRTFVKIYYDTSPPLADVIRDNDGLRTAVREGFVEPLVHIARMFVG
jgi:PKD repeat protein